MAQIRYCDDEVNEGWHPIYDYDSCIDVADAKPRKDQWGFKGPSYEDRTFTARLSRYVFLAFGFDRETEFTELARTWKRETAFNGNLSKIVMHPAYQRIMSMGPEVIPFILRDLAIRQAHWFWALHNLVPQGEDPAEGLTTIEEARQAWLAWGRAHNYL